jgi:hypothetical protein
MFALSIKNNTIMKVTKQEITVENVFEQMALVAKQNLIDRGIFPENLNIQR